MFKHQDLQMLGIKFHPLEIVVCGSETQLQVGENFNKITWRVKG